VRRNRAKNRIGTTFTGVIERFSLGLGREQNESESEDRAFEAGKGDQEER
jgi:hypothetical protein